MNKLFISLMLVSILAFSTHTNAATTSKSPSPVAKDDTIELRIKKSLDFEKKLSDKIESLSAKLTKNKDELKKKLAKIKDEKKQKVVLRINDNIALANQRILSRFSTALDKLAAIINKLDKKGQELAQKGTDVTTLNDAIKKADAAIASARTAIQTQAALTYTISISTDTNLGQDVSKTRQALHDDITKVRDTILTARDAVKDAAKVYRALVPADDSTQASVSPSVSASASPSSTTSPTSTN